MIEDESPGDHQVGGALGAGRPGLPHRLPDDLAAAEDDLVTGAGRPDRQVGLDLDEQVGVGQPHPVTGRGTEQQGITLAVDHGSRRPGTTRAPPSGTSSTSWAMPGSNRSDVPAGTSRDGPVHGHELGPVRERRLHLHLVNELGYAVHDVLAGQHVPAGRHQVTTERPSRAPSSTYDVNTATASG